MKPLTLSRVRIEWVVPSIHSSLLEKLSFLDTASLDEFFDHTGSVTVRGQIASDRKAVVLSITDTGRGMPPAMRDSLFTDRVVSRKAGGTGLGTKIVKDVVDAHDGSISVESEEGKGTTFRLQLPLAGPEPLGGRSA